MKLGHRQLILRFTFLKVFQSFFFGAEVQHLDFVLKRKEPQLLLVIEMPQKPYFPNEIGAVKKKNTLIPN